MCWLLWAVFEIVHIMRCATVTQLWFSRLESWSRDVSSRDSFFKILVLVFWLFILQFCHKISDSELRWTFVGRSLDIKPCLPIFVVCWLLNRWSTSYILISRSFSWLTSLYYVSNDFFEPISYGVVLFVFGLMSFGFGTRNLVLGIGLEHLSFDNKCALPCM